MLFELSSATSYGLLSLDKLAPPVASWAMASLHCVLSTVFDVAALTHCVPEVPCTLYAYVVVDRFVALVSLVDVVAVPVNHASVNELPPLVLRSTSSTAQVSASVQLRSILFAVDAFHEQVREVGDVRVGVVKVTAVYVG